MIIHILSQCPEQAQNTNKMQMNKEQSYKTGSILFALGTTTSNDADGFFPYSNHKSPQRSSLVHAEYNLQG